MRQFFIILLFVGLSFNSELKAQSVFICTGNYSVVYHSKSDCRGLNNCQATIKIVSQEYALNTAERRPCCICWKSDGECMIDDVGNILSRINPPTPQFRPFIPRNPRLAQVEVGMYLQQKYDARKDWIQERLKGLGLLISILFNSEKINCSDCDFKAIADKQWKPITKYSYTLAAVDFANDSNFYSIVQSYNKLERELWSAFNSFLHNPN